MNQDSLPKLTNNLALGDSASESLILINGALMIACIAFVGYLTIPQAFRRQYCNSHRRRYAFSSFVSRNFEREAPRLNESTSLDVGNESLEEGYISFAKKSPSRSFSRHNGILFSSPACLSASNLLPLNPLGESSTKSLPCSSWFTPIEAARKHMILTPTIFQPRAVQFQTNREPLDCAPTHPKKLVMLMSSRCLNPQQEQDQRDAIALLRKRRVHFETVDGMKGIQRSRREELYRISGTRAKYPQFFFVHTDGQTTYLGDFAKIQSLHHAEGLPRRYRMANPDISTWNEIFCDTSQIFSV